MKKLSGLLVVLVLVFGMSMLSSCGSEAEDPGTPPAQVINPEETTAESDVAQNEDAYAGEILEDAVSVRIGREGRTEWSISMYNNAAAVTMLDYLSDSSLLFPTYTYDEEEGFVAQYVRGNYTRDDETEIADVKAGELYLFSGGQLRFYFKDVDGADITATPIGYYMETEGLTDEVTQAYEDNLGDTWGVEVYFWLTKTID